MSSSSWHSYPSIYNLGHKAIAGLLDEQVYVEEKVDGSQFSFGLIPLGEGEEAYSDAFPGFQLKVRSKGAVMHVDAPEKMFTEGVNMVKERGILLHPGWTYRGEYLKKPKHNALAYDRIPKGHVILFDINTGEEEYLGYEAKAAEAARLGLEVVPLLFSGRVKSVEEFRRFLDTPSCLGGQKIEGVVVKPQGYDFYGRDHKTLMGKFVSEAFKEVHKTSWMESNPTSGDILDKLAKTYRTPGRWLKAIQHLRDDGKLQDSPRDISALLIEIQKDTGIECKEEIQKALWKWAWPHVARQITRGFPEFYKEQLLKLQFEREAEAASEPGDDNNGERLVPGDGGVLDSVGDSAELAGAIIERV